MPEAPKGERIAKVIARAGIASRRDAERMIAEGRVSLDGRTLTTPAVTVTGSSRITVDGKALPAAPRPRLWRYHKPRGVITSARDPEGRPTLFEQLPAGLPRLQAVGRLDFNSEGLILLTNDGGLKRRLELPANAWERRYRVRVHGRVDRASLESLAKGLTIAGTTYGPVEASLERQSASNAWLIMTLKEGKNREVRRLCEHLGLTVNRLIRVAYGPFELDRLPPGGIEAVPARLLKSELGLDADRGPPRQPQARKDKASQSTGGTGIARKPTAGPKRGRGPARPGRKAKHAHRRRPS
jgi:23S rRNA pseudouridine2605 synthase